MIGDSNAKRNKKNKKNGDYCKCILGFINNCESIFRLEKCYLIELQLSFL